MSKKGATSLAVARGFITENLTHERQIRLRRNWLSFTVSCARAVPTFDSVEVTRLLGPLSGYFGVPQIVDALSFERRKYHACAVPGGMQNGDPLLPGRGCDHKSNNPVTFGSRSLSRIDAILI